MTENNRDPSLFTVFYSIPAHHGAPGERRARTLPSDATPPGAAAGAAAGTGETFEMGPMAARTATTLTSKGRTNEFTQNSNLTLHSRTRADLKISRISALFVQFLGFDC